MAGVVPVPWLLNVAEKLNTTAANKQELSNVYCFKMISRLTLLCLIFCSQNLLAVNADTAALRQLTEGENRLKSIAPKFIAAKTDEERTEAAWQVYRTLDSLLALPESFDYAWDSLKSRTVSVLVSPDKKVKLYTWNLILKDGSFKHFGYLQTRRKKSIETYPLLDTTATQNKEIVDEELDPAAWYGALYYRLIPFRKNRKTMYLLFGFDGNTANSNKAIMEVLWLSKSAPVFGYPAFRQGENDPSAECRIIMECHNDVKLSFYYEADKQIVVADKLVPSFPEAKDNPYYYIPSGDYDIYRRNRKGTWIRRDLKDWDLGQGEMRPSPVPRPVPPAPPEK
jgi:hypothetical protein